MDIDPTGVERPACKRDGSPILSSPCIGDSSPPCKRPRLRAVASHVRPGERVYPESAYVGSRAHARAMSAKPESEVLSNFLVFPLKYG